MWICDAVLLDFDGVVGNTMEDNFAAWRFAFSRQGISIQKEEYFLLEGLNAKGVTEHFLRRSGKSLALAGEIAALKEQFYLEHNAFSVYEDARHAVPRLRDKGFPLALVSGARRSRLMASLDPEYLALFGAVVTGDSVSNPKPHPEPYLAAARLLGAKPSSCIVVENAPLGIRSAKRAGMRCLAIARTLGKEHLIEADQVIDNLMDIETLLEPRARPARGEAGSCAREVN